MSTPRPASPPFRSDDRNRIYRYVEIERQLKEALWPYVRGGPAFADFNVVDRHLDTVIHDVQLSGNLQGLWKGSELLGYGSHACVRLMDNGVFPVTKLAHPKAGCRQRIEHEFEVMRRLAHLKVVAQVHPEPLKDENGLVGFRLERLYPVTKEESTAREGDIKELLRKLHEAGYCHGDIHFFNTMKRHSGELVLIDFAHAGRLGEAVPESAPKHTHRNRTYSVETDYERMNGRCI